MRVAARLVLAVTLLTGVFAQPPAAAQPPALAMVVPIPTDRADLCARVGYDAGFRGESLVTAIAIAIAESNCIPTARGTNGLTPGCPSGSYDRGLWQINSCYHITVSDTCAYDPACNAHETFRISSKGTRWTPWATYTGGAYLNRVAEARAAIARLRLHVFKRGPNNVLLYKSWNGAWSAWQNLGGVLTSEPAWVSRSGVSIEVFVRGTDGALWRRSWNGAWSPWESLGGFLKEDSGPAAVHVGTATNVFVQGADNALWQRSLNGSVGPWMTLGGVLTAGPGAASWGADRIDVFARGSDSALWRRSWNGSWGGWERLGGVLTSGPAAVSWGFNRIDVFVRGTDNALWHKSWNGAWGPWASQGGVLTSGPATSSWGPTRLDVFVRGTDEGIYHKWWNGRVWQPWDGVG